MENIYYKKNKDYNDLYSSCRLCPRSCNIDRNINKGFCKAGTKPKLARAALHFWEEPCISGEGGSGALFFSNCTLGCKFCQNYEISAEGFGKEITIEELSDLMLRFEDDGAENVDLITATHYLPSVLAALDRVKHKLNIPVVYNCGGYESLESIRRLDGYVDIYLPDMKYYSKELSEKYSMANNYYEYALPAVKEMIRQTVPEPISTADIENGCSYAEHGILKRGVIIRHMVLPGAKNDSIKLLNEISKELPKGHYLISLLSQYTPFYKAKEDPKLNRRITSYEYDCVRKEAIRLGMDGYIQEKSSAKEEYTPSFRLEGLP